MKRIIIKIMLYGILNWCDSSKTFSDLQWMSQPLIRWDGYVTVTLNNLFSFTTLFYLCTEPWAYWLTRQVNEGASGRRAAVWDGEGHGINIRGQIVDIQRQVGVSVCIGKRILRLQHSWINCTWWNHQCLQSLINSVMVIIIPKLCSLCRFLSD